MSDGANDVVERYLELGLRVGRHVDGFVDAYYGPQQLADRVAAEPPRPPAELARDAARLLTDLDAGEGAADVDAGRRRWIRAQVSGLRTSARKLAGEPIGYLDEVEACYGGRPEPVVAEHLRPLGVRYDAEVAGRVSEATEALSWVRSNAAIHLHEDGMPVDDVVAYLERWALLPHERATKAASFMTDPTWRAYSHCYTEGLRLCRGHVDGDPTRFEHLVTEQVLPADLAAA